MPTYIVCFDIETSYEAVVEALDEAAAEEKARELIFGHGNCENFKIYTECSNVVVDLVKDEAA